MKVTVRKRFRDIETRQIMKVGDVAEYDNERAEELARGRFVSIIGEEVLSEDNDAPTGDDDSTDKDNEEDIDNPEKKEVKEEKVEKVETVHIAKSETNKPGKPGRKASK